MKKKQAKEDASRLTIATRAAEQLIAELIGSDIIDEDHPMAQRVGKVHNSLITAINAAVKENNIQRELNFVTRMIVMKLLPQSNSTCWGCGAHGADRLRTKKKEHDADCLVKRASDLIAIL